MFYNNKKQEREIEKQITNNVQLYKRVFGNPDGEAVLKDLEKRCFVNYTTYNDSHGQMSFNEGRRSIFVHIQNLLKKDMKEILEALTKE
jgi:predicted nucleotide-binding protein (sugar kinase/HSP70/actin superfamily)